jgi:hypothetical protein
MSKSNLYLEGGLRMGDFIGVFIFAKWAQSSPEIEKSLAPLPYRKVGYKFLAV